MVLHINLFCISNKIQCGWICNQYRIVHKMTPSLGNLVEGNRLYFGGLRTRMFKFFTGFLYRMHLMQ